MEELRKQCMTWLERTNPLRGLSLSRASSIYDMARVYGSPRLQYMYNEIEQTDPVLLVCADRRESALAGLEWSFVPRANADQTLAQEQADALGRFADEIDNFGELLRHLDSAFFRGFAHAQPIWDGKGVSHVSLLDSWNFLTDRDGNWYWNPRCHETPRGLETVEGARLVSLAHRRSIDYPALFIYIRKALGERDYGRFIERHGIPHAAVIMAPGTEEKDKPQYLAAANAWNNGQDIVLPNAAGINLATEARGTDPFTPFIDHQDKCIVLLATGGTLTSLAQADTGSLAGGAQMEVWREIVARDGVAVADALNRHLFRRYLELEFPGRPMAAKFVMSNEKKPTAGEIADLAVKIKSAGYTVDQAQLEEKTGLKLVKDETPAPQPGMGAPFMNKEVKELPNSAVHLESTPTPILEAFAKDTGPAADAIKALLKTIESGGDGKAEAASLIEKLPELMPEDPAMAAVIAEAMAAEFADAASHPSQEPLEANKEDQPRGKTTEGTNSGSFAPAGGGASACKSEGEGNIGYSDENRSRIGQTGTWDELGLPSLRDIPADGPLGKTKIADARKRIAAGETILDPLGEPHEINSKSISHWTKKKKAISEINGRFQLLDEAEETISRPHEIWSREDGRGKSFVRIVKSDTGRFVVNVAEMVDNTISWHHNEVKFDYWRHGKLEYIRA